ncbi:MAG: putative cellulase [Benjaminiella poitrasii]|nr:MAG: putative cellulase [Benjaminiella poitrasii]
MANSISLKLFSLSILVIFLISSPIGKVNAAIDPREWYLSHPGLAKIGLVDQILHQIKDVYGRVRFFHGTNVVKKSPPWYRSFTFTPGDSFGLADVAYLKSLGVNAVRLGHHWAGSEPVREQYNQTFLDIMKQQTKLAEDHGIYVLVDVHQDILAPQFCGHGVPDWFVKSNWVSKLMRFPFPQRLLPFPVDTNGVPSQSNCASLNTGQSYLTVAVGNAFQRLYTNYDDLGDAFANYWSKLAEQYVNAQNILGYNLLNEPWMGDTYTDPKLLIPGVADYKNMEALWNRAATQIRTVDTNTLIFFEGATLDVLSGFENVPLGDGARSVQSFHYYRPPQLGSISTNIRNRLLDNIRLRTASMLTEFAFWVEDEDAKNNLQEAVDAADKYMMSWMGWAYEHLYDPSGKPYAELARHYSRAYPTAVAGIPKSFGFNATDSSFSLTYVTKKSITAPTEIILPVPTYPNGYNLSISPNSSGVIPYTFDNRTLALFNGDSTIDGQTITITITKL